MMHFLKHTSFEWQHANFLQKIAGNYQNMLRIIDLRLLSYESIQVDSSRFKSIKVDFRIDLG